MKQPRSKSHAGMPWKKPEAMARAGKMVGQFFKREAKVRLSEPLNLNTILATNKLLHDVGYWGMSHKLQFQMIDDIIHSACNGRGGCKFYDDIAARAGDGSKVGWTKDYDEGHYVVCPSGSPQKTIIAKSDVECKSENLVKINKIVNYRGKPVRMVVVTCG